LAYPVLLEAVLGAEITVLDADAETLRALQGASLVFAVNSKALPLRRGFFGHGGVSMEGVNAG
jgi:hypothetical protein